MNWQPWLSFFVPGVPKTAGSKRFCGFYKGKRGQKIPYLKDDCDGSDAWKATCGIYARKAYKGPPLGKEAIRLEMIFYMQRPKKDFRTGKFAGILKDNAQKDHLQKPDHTKLYRCAEDGFTGILYADDSTVVSPDGSMKTWDNNGNPGIQVTIYRKGPPE